MSRKAMIFLPFIGLLAACVDEPEFSGARLFAENCASCHGADGRGDGDVASGLPVALPDLTLLSQGNGGVFPRVAVMSQIDGYQRGGHYADVMPEFGAGDLGPAIVVELEEGVGTPVPQGLLALADHLESIQRQ